MLGAARRRALATLVVGALLVPGLLAAAAPPAVVPAATTGLTLAVAPGGATLVRPGGGQATYAPTTATVVKGTLPLTTITDVRTLGGAWTVTVSSTAFQHATVGGVSVARGAVRAYLDAPSLPALTTTLLGLGTVGSSITNAALPATAADLTSARMLLTGTTNAGGGTIVFAPTVEVTIPAATPAGTYSAVVTQTVS